jgi:4-hydroxyphenylacetate 3-monooxygenase
VGEVIAWRNLFWSLSDAMVYKTEPWNDEWVLPNIQAVLPYRVMMTYAYPRIKEIISNLIASGLIYLPASGRDFNSDIGEYLQKYMRGSYGIEAMDRVKMMKLLWDAIGSEFGSRHELYERNYSGSHETIRFENLAFAEATGDADAMMEFVEACMNDYDLDGWTVPDLINPTDVNFFNYGFRQNDDEGSRGYLDGNSYSQDGK